jgi:hypothetical protein
VRDEEGCAQTLRAESSDKTHYNSDEKASLAGSPLALVDIDLPESVDVGTVLERANFIISISVQNIAFDKFSVLMLKLHSPVAFGHLLVFKPPDAVAMLLLMALSCLLEDIPWHRERVSIMKVSDTEATL